MEDAAGPLGVDRMTLDQNQRIADVVQREGVRLRRFIRGRVPDARDAEDILQDVFAEFVEANRLLMPIDHVTGWLFRVARNRITDFFRRKKPERFETAGGARGEDDRVSFEDLLPSPGEGPEETYLRNELLDELGRAIGELPDEQRQVFVAHELEGRSFKEIAATTGIGLNTLLSRKRYAVLRLRGRLRDASDELTKG